MSLLNKIYDEGRVEETQRALTDIPDGLERLFSGILGTLTHAPETLVILQWVLLSQIPLELRELFAAITQMATSDIELMKRRITMSSKGLVEIPNGQFQSVQFIHLSVSDFLFRQQRLRTLDPTLGEDPIAASHGRLWARCRDSIDQAITTAISHDQMRNARDKDPFLDYAASYILDHAERAVAGVERRAFSDSPRCCETDRCHPEHSLRQICIKQWLQGSNHWFDWWKEFQEVHDPSDEDPGLMYLPRVGLAHTLARRGLLNLLRATLVEADVDVQDDEHGTVLQAACSGSQTTEVIEWLLAVGADVNAQGGQYGTALQIAAARRSRSTVELLLSAGADVNARCEKYGTALQVAADGGSRSTVELLLSAGADVNARCGKYGNALQAAALAGNRETIDVLLNAGAHVNAAGGEYGTALQTAVFCGRPDIVKLLLDAGANVNAQGGYYGSALEAAARCGSEEVIKLLLDVGADVNMQCNRYGNALQATLNSSNPRIKVVKLLLAAGADPSLLRFEDIPLPRQKIIKLLLAAGADPSLPWLEDVPLSRQESITRAHEQPVEAALQPDRSEEAVPTRANRSWVSRLFCRS